MEPFAQIWDSSRTNSLSWMYPTTFWCGAGVLIALGLIKNRWLRQIGKLVVIAGCSVMATEFSSQEIQEKWRLRREWAEFHPAQMTEDGYHALTVDGANMTLGPLIYGFQAFLLLTAIAALLSILRKLILSRRVRKVVGTDVDVAGKVAVPASDNPYCPPSTSI